MSQQWGFWFSCVRRPQADEGKEVPSSTSNCASTCLTLCFGAPDASNEGPLSWPGLAPAKTGRLRGKAANLPLSWSGRPVTWGVCEGVGGARAGLVWRGLNTEWLEEEVEEECSRGHHSCFGCDGLGMKAGQRGQVGRGMGPQRVIDRRRELPWKYASGCWSDAKEEFSWPLSVMD